MKSFLAWLKRVLGLNEHAAIDDIMAPLTRIKDALADLNEHAANASDALHRQADDTRDRAYDFSDKAAAAARAHLKLAAFFSADEESYPAGPVEGALAGAGIATTAETTGSSTRAG